MPSGIPTQQVAETFVPIEILEALQQLQAEKNFGSDPKKYNTWLMQNRPSVPRSTRTRWVRAFIKGLAHSVTPTWHTRYREDMSLVPKHFSVLRTERLQAEREKWMKSGGIRYANISDFHRPHGDGALITLGLRIVQDFQPNIMPAFSDWLDMDRFSQHAKKSGSYTVEFDDDAEQSTQRRNKIRELEQLSLETLNIVKSYIPETCSLLNVWGNHEQWLLRYIINMNSATPGSDDFAEYFIENYFKMLDDNGVMWIEGDRNHWFPITREFWIAHGHRAKGGANKTPIAYLNYTKFAASIAVGHTHRQEVVFQEVPYVGQRFCAVAGTLGPVQPFYASRDFLGHSWGFQLIEHPVEGCKGSHVEDVRIHYRDGYYVARAFGKEYSEPSTVQYDEFHDFI